MITNVERRKAPISVQNRPLVSRQEPNTSTLPRMKVSGPARDSRVATMRSGDHDAQDHHDAADHRHGHGRGVAGEVAFLAAGHGHHHGDEEEGEDHPEQDRGDVHPVDHQPHQDGHARLAHLLPAQAQIAQAAIGRAQHGAEDRRVHHRAEHQGADHHPHVEEREAAEAAHHLSHLRAGGRAGAGPLHGGDLGEVRPGQPQLQAGGDGGVDEGRQRPDGEGDRGCGAPARSPRRPRRWRKSWAVARSPACPSQHPPPLSGGSSITGALSAQARFRPGVPAGMRQP